MCFCPYCEASRLGMTRLEYAFRNQPREIKLLRRFPNHPGYMYVCAARYEVSKGKEIEDEMEFKWSRNYR